MSVQLVHPEGVAQVPVHHQVSIARGATIVSVAGQVSWDAESRLVGAGDLAAQTEQAYLNVAAALHGAGATTADLTRVVVYVVDLDAVKAEAVLEGRRRAAERLGVEFQHPGTFVGVTALFDPAYLVEVEATAVVD